jgi:LuxR family transcriptional regulator, maltose regulon positive regulatory protein
LFMTNRQIPITKIVSPSVKGVLFRERLFQVLDVTRGRPVTWISSPAGSGKTILAASYLHARCLPCIWYQVDMRDNDPGAFFHFMSAAIRKESRKKASLPLFNPEQVKDLVAFTRGYFERLYDSLVPSTLLVLDNYQDVGIRSPFHEMISQGLDVIPEGFTFVVLSRDRPPPCLARLIAGDRLASIGWDEIRLTLDETEKIIRLKGWKKFPQEMLLGVHQKTQGWAAGLVLMLSGKNLGGIDPESLGGEFPQGISDYLEKEVFEKMETDLQDFLMKTVLLPRITVPAAEKLIETSGAREILSRLWESHFFIERYDSPTPVYQHHPLFREFLLSKLEEVFPREEISLMRRRTAQVLEDSGQIEFAMALFLEAKDWDSVRRLAVLHAPLLLAQGRQKTVQGWIKAIPGEKSRGDPWLLFWLAGGIAFSNWKESLALYERSLHCFESENDLNGMFMAWARLVGMITHSWENMERLDEWIDWLDRKVEKRVSFTDPTVEALVFVRMALALFLKRPERSDIEKWLERSLALSSLTKRNHQFDIQTQVASFYFWRGDFLKSKLLTEDAERLAQSGPIVPLRLLTLKDIKAGISMVLTGDHEEGLRLVSVDIENARKSGIDTAIPRLYGLGVEWSLEKGDSAGASDFLKKMGSCPSMGPRLMFQYHSLASRCYLRVNDFSRSFAHEQEALKIAQERGLKFFEAQSWVQTAQIRLRQGDLEKAEEALACSEKLIPLFRDSYLECSHLMAAAYLCFSHGEEEKGLESIRKGLRLGREKDYANLGEYQSPMMTALCIKALDAGIEVEYIQNLIRRRHLFPEEPPIDIDLWPWPVRIYTLGGFEVLRDGKRLLPARKVQKRPLLLLKALIALGRKEVGEGQLADMVWPEAEGDAAHDSFKMALSRLRHLAGSERVVEVSEGRISLNPRYCWVDAWAFERISDKTEASWKDSQSREEMAGIWKLAEKAIGLYKGSFLPEDQDLAWSTSYRERLRNKYLRLTLRVGRGLEQANEWKKAVEYYQRALDIDEYSEEFYQHLMLCYQRLGYYSEAILAYQRCKKTLSENFGIEPSPQTQALYKNLIRQG